MQQGTHKGFQICIFYKQLAIFDDKLDNRFTVPFHEEFTLHRREHVSRRINDHFFEECPQLAEPFAKIAVHYLNHRLHRFLLDSYPFVNHFPQEPAVESSDVLTGV